MSTDRTKPALCRQSIRKLTKNDLRIAVGGNLRTTSALCHMSSDCPK